jgi:hypothetical protein
MRTLALIAVAAAVASVPNDDGQKINISAMTCSQFLKVDRDRSDLILSWFLGFYAEAANPQIIDLTKLDRARDQFNTFCAEEPSFRMTTAAEGLLGK